MENSVKENLNKLLLASSISLVLVAASATVLDHSTAKEANAAGHEAQIETTYTLSPYLRSYEIDVDAVDGKATLSGIVDSDIFAELAHQIALGVHGIESADNQIQVQTEHVRAERNGNERGFGEVVDAASIAAASTSKLLLSTDASNVNTKVETHNGVVTLSGPVPSASERALAVWC